MIFQFKQARNNFQYKGELYIANIPENVNETGVKNYFTQYGAVSSVILYEKKYKRKRRTRKFRFGFVKFKNPQSAIEPLLYKWHYLGDNQIITIKIANDWEVPPTLLVQKKEKQLSEKKCKRIYSEENSILRLNDDCLIYIFRFLSLKEQLILSLLGERFERIFLMVFKSRKTIKISSAELSPLEIEQLLTLVSDQVENLQLQNMNTNEFREIFIKYSYRNLRSLEISNVDYGYRNYQYVFDYIISCTKNINRLEKITLINVGDISDNIKYLSQLPNLTYLEIHDNVIYPELKLNGLSKIKQLNLSKCFILPHNFSQICYNMNLEYLNIWGCCKLAKLNFMEIELHLTQLTCLVINCTYETSDLHHVAGIKSLTQLIIYDTETTPTDYLFSELARLKADTLEELILGIQLNESKKEHILSMKALKKLSIFFNSQIDDKFLRKLERLSNLTHLNLTGCALITQNGIISLFQCTNINLLQSIDISFCRQNICEIIYSVIENMKKYKRLLHCRFYFDYMDQYEYILTDPKFLENKRLLSISFKRIELTDNMCDNLHKLIHQAKS